MSRCVRRAYLCGDGFGHRRSWIQKRLEELVSLMAIDIYAWEILTNHMHILLGIRPDIVETWTDHEVVHRYLQICPCKWRRRLRGIPVDDPPTEAEIAIALLHPGRVKRLRSRMSSVSWFMAKLKEPIARRANREDECTGHFWEGRFRCFAVLDQEAILATATYVDLNAIRAGLVERPEDTKHGSIAQRALLLRKQSPTCSIELQPIPGISESEYLTHVDQWARAFTPGKQSMPNHVLPVLERLGFTARSWAKTLKSAWITLAGTAIGTANSLQEEAQRRCGQWVRNPLHGPAG
jgi:REP element-mobilizing transposase RayT